MVYSSSKKSLIIIKLLYNLLTSLNQEEKEVKRLERSRVFKAKEIKGLYKLTKKLYNNQRFFRATVY